MWLLAVLTCALVTCAYALLWLKTRRARKLLAHLPTFPTVPFFGNTLSIRTSDTVLYLVDRSTKIIDEKNLPFVWWIGPVPGIFFSDYEDVKAVANNFLDKPYHYSFARPYVGDGLVTAPSHIWKQNVKKIASTFNKSIVDGFQKGFNEQAAKLVDKLKLEVGKGPFDMFEKYLSFTTLQAICQAALGMDQLSGDLINAEYHKSYVRVFELFTDRGFDVTVHLEWMYRLTPAYKEFKKCIAVLHNVSEKIIAQRKKEREETKKTTSLTHNDMETGKTRCKAFLDALLDLAETDPTMTDEYIRNEVDTIIFGGQDSIATTLGFTFLMLGNNVEIQNKLYDEMMEIFGDSKRPVDQDDMIRMKYCEAVIMETLRLYPAFPCCLRNADRELQLKSCTVPVGAICVISPWVTGRNTRAWGPDARQYRPERWLEKDGVPGYPNSFFPFSYGKRSCIGKKYAFPILKTILAYCVRELRFTADAENLRMKLEVALKPAGGHLVQVHLR